MTNKVKIKGDMLKKFFVLMHKISSPSIFLAYLRHINVTTSSASVLFESISKFKVKKEKEKEKNENTYQGPILKFSDVLKYS